MKIQMPGPLAGPGPHGPIESWGPAQVVEVDDGDDQAVAWARGWLGMGAELVEDTSKASKAAAKAEASESAKGEASEAEATPPPPPPPTQPTDQPTDQPATPSEPPEPTLAELREQAKAKGLPTYGSKAELVERLAATQGRAGTSRKET